MPVNGREDKYRRVCVRRGESAGTVLVVLISSCWKKAVEVGDVSCLALHGLEVE